MEKVIKSLVAGVCLLAVAGCATTPGNTQLTPTELLANIETFAKQVSNGVLVTDATLAPAACGLAGTVYSFGEAAEASGLLKASAKLQTDLVDINAIYTSTLCAQALAGQTITNPLTIITQVASLVLTIAADSNGVVTAVKATSSAAPAATVSLKRRLNAQIRLLH